jgi:ATP-dependent RNA helicase RhlE
VSHLALPVPAHRKAALLRELLLDETMTSVLVFARTKHRADRLARQLSEWKIPATVIHGNRSQSQRIHALEGFRVGHHRVLVATDIAARGIDVEGVSHVVNFDVPHEAEVYVHRVGRTARAERTGTAFTLVSSEEEPDFSQIESLLGFEVRRARIPGFDYEAPPPPRSEVGRDRGPRFRSARPRDRQRGPPSGGGHRGHAPGRGTVPGPRRDGESRRYRRW